MASTAAFTKKNRVHQQKKVTGITKMKFPMLRQCCFGCTLRTGSIIIAVFNVICGVYFLATGGIFLSSESTTNKGVGLAAAGGILSIVGVLVLLAGLMLFIGAMKEIPLLLIPYITLAMLSAVANIVTTSIAAVNFYRVKGDSSDATPQIVVLVLYLLFQTYFTLVVYSLYKQQEAMVPSTTP